ncbi:hypothetical protein [EBPR siphovirus 2]|nr:hypothetical protein [EBPR siphovirus 2]
MLWLDHLIFGNGYGLGSPYFDNKFYWLVDTNFDRRHKYGRLYTLIGGHGAQLSSREWTHPKPGTRRRLLGREFQAFSSTRKGPRVDVSWAIVRWRDGDSMDLLKRDLDSVMMEDTSYMHRSKL